METIKSFDSPDGYIRVEIDGEVVVVKSSILGFDENGSNYSKITWTEIQNIEEAKEKFKELKAEYICRKL